MKSISRAVIAAASLLSLVAAPGLPASWAAEPGPAPLSQRSRQDATQRYREAAAVWQGIVADYPTNPVAHYNLGIAFGRQGQWPAAIDAYRQAIALDPNFAHAYYNLGRALVETDQLAAAAQAYGAAQRLNPQDSLIQALIQELQGIAKAKGISIAISVPAAPPRP